MAELVSYQQSLLLKPALISFIDENNSQVELENDLDNIDKNCLNGMPSESENHTPTESYQSTNEETQSTNETILHVLSTAPLQTLGNLSIGTITKVDIAEAPKPIWIEKNETAKRIRGRIETIFDYAKTMGYFEGDNPAE